MAISSAGNLVVANDERVWDLLSDGSVARWEWVTEPSEGWGGVVAPVSALAFGNLLTLGVGACPAGMDSTPAGVGCAAAPAGSEALYVGSKWSELSVRDGAGAYTRIGRDEGLPLANVTVLLPSSHDGTAELWVGSEHGVALWNPAFDPAWRYMGGPRWLVGEWVRSMARVGDSTVVVSDGGVTWLAQEAWTLAQKAAHYERLLLSRHERHGLTAECRASAFGAQEEGCLSSDSDNNGLWTSLVVAAEYLRYAATGEDDALASGSRFFAGLVLLFEVTGKRGFPARSACAPNEFHVTCGGGLHDKTKWLPSSVRKYAGWAWKSDTSSDEIVGHVLALLVVSQLSPRDAERARAASLLVELMGGICTSGYALIDVTGQPTTWGVWGPDQVNKKRSFSDERGLQSLQILAFVAAAFNVSADGPQAALWRASYAELTSNAHQYLANMLNLKITFPGDDNYSDDELAFLPYLTLLAFACPPASACDAAYAGLRTAALRSLARTGAIVRPLRSSLWSAILLATDEGAARISRGARASGAGRASGVVRDGATERIEGDLASLRWNLQNWPLELVDWPTSNEARVDLEYEDATDRFGRARTQTTHRRSPLPANERRQLRWNANPYDVSTGGDGKSEGDPGAWLLPYWLGRATGFISEHE